MATSAAKHPFLFNSWNGRGVDRCQIRIDDARLRLRRGAQSLAKQPFGSIGITQRRQQEVNCGTRRIDRSIQVTPATFHLDVSLVDTPRLVGWLQMASQALVKFRTIPLHPAPYGRVVGFQTTFLEQLFDIAQRKRVPKVPADRTENKLRLRLPPFEDCRPGRHLGLFKLPAALSTNVATQPSTLLSAGLIDQQPFSTSGQAKPWPNLEPVSSVFTHF